jgi:hypothetical protein
VGIPDVAGSAYEVQIRPLPASPNTENGAAMR